MGHALSRHHDNHIDLTRYDHNIFLEDGDR